MDSRKKQEILEILKTRRGAENAIKYADLAARVGLADSKCRDYVRDLIVSSGHPIGSSYKTTAGGYYWIVRKSEKLDTAQKLLRAGFAQIKRARAIKSMGVGEIYKQMKLAIG